jgi:hypothetical protein
LEAHYDFAGGGDERLGFGDVCNYLVHHFAFAVRYDACAADDISIFFNSDRSMDRLFRMALRVYLTLVDEVAYDETGWVNMDASTKKDAVIRRRQRPWPPP